MLARHIASYLPSLIVPAAVSFISIFAYTRLLSPHEYGYYALCLSGMALINAIAFYWLQTAIPRLMPLAMKHAKVPALRLTSLTSFALVCLALCLCAAAATLALPPGRWKALLWFSLALASARSLLNIVQAFHRSALEFRRYNVIECSQAVLGLSLGLTLVWFAHLREKGALFALISSMVIVALLDRSQWRRMSPRDFSRPLFKDLAYFGWPLALSYGFAFITASADRFLIEWFAGTSAVGMYAAGYGLIDRIGQIIFMMIATPSFPLTVHRLEQEGMEAARRQTYHNGVAIFALALPACAGLALVARPLANLLIGPEFREQALMVMPWITFATFFNGLAAHYFDHAFHLARKPYLLLFTQGPAALVNILLNLLWIPRFGIMGAAYATVASYVLLVILSICVGRRAFPIHFPFLPALRISGAVAIMVAGVRLLSFGDSVYGLIAMVVCGGVFYAAGLLLFNAMEARALLLRFVSSRRHTRKEK